MKMEKTKGFSVNKGILTKLQNSQFELVSIIAGGKKKAFEKMLSFCSHEKNIEAFKKHQP